MQNIKTISLLILSLTVFSTTAWGMERRSTRKRSSSVPTEKTKEKMSTFAWTDGSESEKGSARTSPSSGSSPRYFNRSFMRMSLSTDSEKGSDSARTSPSTDFSSKHFTRSFKRRSQSKEGKPSRGSSYQSLEAISEVPTISFRVEYTDNSTNPDFVRRIDEKKQTSLIQSVRQNNIMMVEKLLQLLEVDVNHQDVYGKTALHYAASEGFLAIVEMLVTSYRTNSFIADNYGHYPKLEVATKVPTTGAYAETWPKIATLLEQRIKFDALITEYATQLLTSAIQDLPPCKEIIEKIKNLIAQASGSLDYADDKFIQNAIQARIHDMQPEDL